MPESRTAATSDTVKLGVVRIRATSGMSQSPIVLGVGGPGANGLAEATPAWVGAHADILKDHDWVFFTQRGSLGAEPFLDCEGYSLRELNAGTQGLTPKESRAAGRAAFQACVADFTAKGVDLGAFNSVENAADIVDIKDALGYDKIVYVGESYGTQLGQFLLRDHPDALSAIVLDGVVPVTKTSEIQVTDIPASFKRVWAACAADAGCAKAYPDPEGTLRKTIKALDKKPAKVTVDLGQGSPTEISVDGSLAMQAMFLNLYTGDFDLLPARIYQLAAGDTSALEPLLRLYFGNISRSRVMHFAINCTDDPATQADLKAKVPALYERLYRDNVRDSLEACAALKVPQLPDSSDALVTSDIPALVLQGGMDPATWTDGGDSVAAGLSNAFNITFPAGGHIQSGSACGTSILTAFLADPTTKPDTVMHPGRRADGLARPAGGHERGQDGSGRGDRPRRPEGCRPGAVAGRRAHRRAHRAAPGRHRADGHRTVEEVPLHGRGPDDRGRSHGGRASVEADLVGGFAQWPAGRHRHHRGRRRQRRLRGHDALRGPQVAGQLACQRAAGDAQDRGDRHAVVGPPRIGARRIIASARKNRWIRVSPSIAVPSGPTAFMRHRGRWRSHPGRLARVGWFGRLVDAGLTS